MEAWKSLYDASSPDEKEQLDLLAHHFRRKILHQQGTYLSSFLQMDIEQPTERTMTLRAPNTSFVQNSLNILHGGIAATYIDTAMGVLANRYCGPEHQAVTTDLKLHYTAAGIGETFICHAEIIEDLGKRYVMKSELSRDDGTIIAHATATFFILPRRT